MPVTPGKRAAVKIRWDGIPELRDTFKAIAKVLDDKTDPVKDVLQVPAEAAMYRARNLAPLGATGDLRRSLSVHRRTSRYRGVLMTSDKKIAYYAVFVEYGTAKMKAEPFFRPAVIQMSTTYVADISPGLTKLVESEAEAKAYHASK